MHVHELLDLALRDDIGCVASTSMIRMLLASTIIWKARRRKIAHQDTGRVAEAALAVALPRRRQIHRPHRRATTWRCDELHHSRQVETLVAFVAQRPQHKSNKGWPQALSTSRNDVVRHIIPPVGHLNSGAMMIRSTSCMSFGNQGGGGAGGWVCQGGCVLGQNRQFIGSRCMGRHGRCLPIGCKRG